MRHSVSPGFTQCTLGPLALAGEAGMTATNTATTTTAAARTRNRRPIGSTSSRFERPGCMSRGGTYQPPRGYFSVKGREQEDTTRRAGLSTAATAIRRLSSGFLLRVRQGPVLIDAGATQGVARRWRDRLAGQYFPCPDLDEELGQ